MNKILTRKEVCELLGVDPTTLYRWEKRGRIKPAFRTPLGHRRYLVEDINKLMGK